ncbi:MAG TPA: hypothetical protein VHA80_15210, partial [Solirubrobacterales bacterium]|nr:hypothetical protein [Solirubrobacterales bacterium]
MDEPTNDLRLTDAQHRILAALRRPLAAGGAAPATDEEIAAELSFGLGAVREQLRVLYGKFGIEDLPDDRRRARLAELA